ncbi:MAG: hypothetical protein KF764_20375 [Labilithrix sp.]|nr:hypothetical protein [Labilithrix sp.]
MREDVRAIRPEPKSREIFVLSGWIVNDPIDVAPDADDAAVLEVLEEKLRRVARVCGLLRREEPSWPTAASKSRSQLGLWE